MKNLFFFFLCITMIASLVLASCSSPTSIPITTETITQESQPSKTEKTDVVTLTFWNGFTGPDRPYIEGLVSEFQESHPHIQIQMDIQPWDSLYQKLPTAISSGQGPDIMGIHAENIPQYVSKGFLVDISSEYKEGSNLDESNFASAVIDLLKVDGKIYGAPMVYYPLALYYNKNLFEKAGLDPEKPPTNWDEWIEAILITTDEDAKQYGLALPEINTIPNWPILLWGNGGGIMKDGESILATPETVEALELWSDLVINKKISPIGLSGGEADKLFQTEKAAMEVNGPWLTPGLDEAGINYDVVPVPAGPAAQVTYAGAAALTINSKSEKLSAAMEFLDFWNSKDAIIYLSLGTGFPPSRLDIKDDPKLAEGEWVAKFAQSAPFGFALLPGMEQQGQIMSEIFTPMIQKITTTEMSAEEAAFEANQKLMELLED